MKSLSHLAVKHRLLQAIAFALLAIAGAVLIPFVSINYDDTVYLPEDSNTKAGLEAMRKAFGDGGSAIGMLSCADINEMLACKAVIEEIDGVESVVWLDDILLPLVDGDSAMLGALIKAIDILKPDANATGMEVFSNLTSELAQDEIMALMKAFEGISGGGFGMGALGEEYANGVSALKTQLAMFINGDKALYQIAFTKGDYAPETYRALEKIGELPFDMHLSGNAAATYDSQKGITNEVIIGSIAAAIVVLTLLTLFSSSWIEPVIYIIILAASVALNMGTNALLGSVSYLTNSIACILQMVLTVDYAIFLLSRYKKERADGSAPTDAMRTAYAKSLSPISASSLTTIACFITIMFMKYRMGLDMGLVLGKGIVCSLLGVFLLLPELIIAFDSALIKTAHKSIRLKGERTARFIFKYKYVIIAVTVFIAIPALMLSGSNSFSYGMSATQADESEAKLNRCAIESAFGRQETLAILVKEGDDAKEAELCARLKQIEGVISVSGYAEVIQSGFAELMPEKLLSGLDGNGMHRIVLSLDCDEEGEETKLINREISNAVSGLYSKGEYYLLGNTQAAIDMEASTKSDYSKISMFSLLAVAVIVAITFKSPLLAVLLVAIIECGIHINMAIPAVTGSQMAFIGYMIIVNILLGSTIDYAILMTSNYLEGRKALSVNEALEFACSHSLRALATSAGIFTLGGAVVVVFMSSGTVRMIGNAILRGGVCAFLLTVISLPAFLSAFDRLLVRKKKHKGAQ